MNFLCDVSNHTIGVLGIVVIILGVLIGIAVLVAGALQWILSMKLRDFVSENITKNKTANEVVRHYLDASGLEDVEIKKCNVFRLLFIGEGYSPKHNVIFLRNRVNNSKKINLVASALRYIGFAKIEKEHEVKHKIVSRLMPFATFVPFTIFPMIVVGLLLDLAVWNNPNLPITLILGLISFIFYISTFVVLLLNIPVQKKANQYALEIIKSDDLLTYSEIQAVESLYKLFVTKYVSDFLVSVLYLIKNIVKIVLFVLINSKKK